MPLSADGLNGFPTDQDPDPGSRSTPIQGINGWPEQREALQKKREDGTPAEQKRRIQLAAANRERALHQLRNEAFLNAYEIPAPVKVPGEKKDRSLFSRWLKDQGDKRTHFPDLDSFCQYVMENYGDAEKDAKWRAFLEGGEKTFEEQIEALRQETEQALDAVEHAASRPAPRILPTSELVSHHEDMR